MGATGLRLRPLLPGDEAAFLAAHEAMAREDFAFGLGYQPGQPWSDYLAQLERQRCGIALPPGSCPRRSSSRRSTRSASAGPRSATS